MMLDFDANTRTNTKSMDNDINAIISNVELFVTDDKPTISMIDLINTALVVILLTNLYHSVR